MRTLLLVLALTLAAAAPAKAADFVTAWVKQLQLDGYEEVTTRTTWLGRIRIIAEKDDIIREIILNARTGEVLRDYSRREDGSFELPLDFETSLDDEDDEDDDENDDAGEDQDD